jgi:anhydro-N-acetylmuramic acid kinase
MIGAIGLMSGTSMDGVDAAYIETDGGREIRVGPTAFLAYSEEDRALLRAALAAARTLRHRDERDAALAQAERMVTERHGEAVEALRAKEPITPAIVGFHGQTVIHRPQERLTVQIGVGAALANRVRLPVVYDFRAADVAAGGEGAPLVPVFHRALVEATGLTGALGLLNIGGVANLTLVPGQGADPIACDTGPGNALIDDLMRLRCGAPFDRDGAMAATGQVDEAALSVLADHPYFDRLPPKSLDRNAFSLQAVAHLSVADAAATVTAFTAWSVADLVGKLAVRPGRVIVCGGGARNTTLMRELGQRLPMALDTAAALGWSVDHMEAQAFAYLAVRSLKGLPLTFPSTTGVTLPLTGGKLARPARL